MRLTNFHALLSACLMVVMGASAVAAGSIQVSYIQPEKFSDIGTSSHVRENAMGQLTQHFESLAKRYLADGQRLSVEVLDVDLAGTVQPMTRAGQDLRVLKDSGDWPRINLRYTLETAGKPGRSGEQKLSDMNYMRYMGAPGTRQPFQAEKRMLDEWFAAQFGPAAAK
ncbi:MAG TPA: DUF3016 domain-containing protein [Burkholderiaceae bacterium]